MKNWSNATKITVALVAVLVLWLVGRAVLIGRMTHVIAHDATGQASVEAARKLILDKKLARVFKDSTNHAKFQAIRTAQIFAADPEIVIIEDHHLTMAEAAAGALVEFLSDLELPVRAAAADALGRMGKPAARPLVAIALDSPDKDVRSNATRALVAIGVPAVPEMIEAVKGGKPTMKVGAATALGELGTTRAIPALIGALSAKEADVRLTSRDSLVTLGQPAVSSLIGALGDKSAFTRRHAAEALGEIRDPAAAAPLLVLFEDEHRQVQLAAVYAVGKVGDPMATAPLIAKLGATDREVREGAAVSLGHVGDQRGVAPLVTALQDPVEAVREQAAAALGRIQPQDIAQLERIDAASRASGEGARMAAIFALGQIGLPGSVTAVSARLDPAVERSEKVRRRAAEALGKIGVAAGVPALLRAFNDPDWRVNYAAQTALAEIGGPAVPVLLRLMETGEPLQVRYARKALAQVSPPPVEALAQLLRSPTPEVRINAALALGDLRTDPSLELLKALSASDPDDQVQFVARRALRSHGQNAPESVAPSQGAAAGEGTASGDQTRPGVAEAGPADEASTP